MLGCKKAGKLKKAVALFISAILLSACGAAGDTAAPINTPDGDTPAVVSAPPAETAAVNSEAYDEAAAAAEILSAIAVDGVPLYQGESTGSSFFVDGARIVLYSEEPATYTITGSISIPAGNTLTVEDGSTLTFAPETVLTVEEGGTLLNRGTILVPEGDDSVIIGPGGEIVDGGEIVVFGALENVGEIVNDNVIWVRNNGSIFTNGTYRGGAQVSEGAFTNLGTLIIGQENHFAVHGELLNGSIVEENSDGPPDLIAQGEIHIWEGGILSIGKTGSFVNKGILNNGENNRLNDGTGGATAVKGGEISIGGRLISENLITNHGELLVWEGGKLDSNWNIYNYGAITVENDGAFQFNANEFGNEGIISTYGDFTVAGDWFYTSGTLNIMGGSAVISFDNFQVLTPEEGYPTIEIKEEAVVSVTGNLPKEPGIYQYINDSWERR